MTDEGPVRWVPKTAFVMPILPPALNIDPVLASLLHCVAFLELSGDDAVDPDWAVEAMEYVATYLQRLPQAQLRTIEQQLASAAQYTRSQDCPAHVVEFLDKFLDHCGLRGEDPA